MANQRTCFRCEEKGTTKEHFPPKSFFPPKSNLQLKTVRACKLHNNGKSDDDQYVLAHITLHGAHCSNTANTRFWTSVAPWIKKNNRFLHKIIDGSKSLNDGNRSYVVDLQVFDRFFDSFCAAIFFDRYGTKLRSENFKVGHFYNSFQSIDSDFNNFKTFIEGSLQHLKSLNAYEIPIVMHDFIDEPVYDFEIIDPLKINGSITIHHRFYGFFKATSYLTNSDIHPY